MPMRKQDREMMQAVHDDLVTASETYRDRAAEIAGDDCDEPWTTGKVVAELTLVSRGLKQFASLLGMYLARNSR